MISLFHNDCLTVLPTFEENSIDAGVTDPPYCLNFMGKAWDNNIASDPNTWRAVFRVLKPGAHMLVFGGSRTHHRVWCAIEDAGFECRDTLMWIYASGFPKSHNVALGIDKLHGHPDRGHRLSMTSRHHPDGRFEPNGEHLAPYQAKSDISAPWQGYGTALKPAHEPILLCRKPLSEDSVAANVLRWRTGAINVDAGRIPLAPNDKLQDGLVKNSHHRMDTSGQGWGFKNLDREAGLARYPANVLHDGSDEVLEAFGGTAARFFFSSKANARDRQGSMHPTVKPVRLLEYLCKMIVPMGGTVLDPFAGTGTTGEAAVINGFSPILIEREANYCADIERRLALWLPRRRPEKADVATEEYFVFPDVQSRRTGPAGGFAEWGMR